jgi:hypothetical protein
MDRRMVLFAVLLLVFSVTCLPSPVTRNQARAAATTHLTQVTEVPSIALRPEAVEPETLLSVSDTGQILGYVFGLLPTGYVVVSADTRMEPIIAYSLSSSFSWQDVPQNTLLHLVREDLSLRMAALSADVVSSEYVQSNESRWTALLDGDLPAPTEASTWGPWIPTPTWSQGSPYSDFCPIDPDTELRCPTGCGPTAIAQILNYWHYPVSVDFTHEDDYTTETRSIVLNATTAIIASIDYNLGYPSNDVKAALSYAAGVAVRADYTSDGTSSWSANLASSLGGGLPEWGAIVPVRWHYASTDFRTARSEWAGIPPYYVTEEELYNLLRNDAENARPSIATILSPEYGHFIVIDGYRSTGEYHANFGWEGSYDSWYFLPDELPYGFNVLHTVVVNILPPMPEPTAAVFRVDAQGNVMSDATVRAALFAAGEADVAEWVAVSEVVEPGDVLVLDPFASQSYERSATACSSLVGGVVSQQPGVILGTDPETERGALLALAGIVTVKVTDEGGSIQPGDLLVTSSTPGHAMRWAGEEPCLCALVGKALEPMTDEAGVILVLLTAH